MTAPLPSSTFCVMPWINLGTETNGKCKICCVVPNLYIKKPDGSDYHIHQDAVEDIFNSDYVKNVRRQMLNGEWPMDCSYCQKQDQTGAHSPRLDYNSRWFNENLQNELKQSLEKNGEGPSRPVSLEPRPGTTCNLKCNTCWSMSSSKIFAERQFLLEEPSENLPQHLRDAWDYEVREAKQSNFRWAEDSVYLDNLQRCLPTLERLYFTGGEPTLIPSNLRFMRELLKQGKTNTIVSLTTNLTLIDDELLAMGRQFSNFELTGSVDAFGAANEYIRFPTRWSDVSRNIERIVNQGFSLTLMSVIQIANIDAFVQLLRWLAVERPFGHLHVVPTLLQEPLWLRPELLTIDLKKSALATLDSALADERINEYNRLRLKDVRRQVAAEHPEAVTLRAQFRDFTRVLDRARGTSFEKTFPHLGSLLTEES